MTLHQRSAHAKDSRILIDADILKAQLNHPQTSKRNKNKSNKIGQYESSSCIPTSPGSAKYRNMQAVEFQVISFV